MKNSFYISLCYANFLLHEIVGSLFIRSYKIGLRRSAPFVALLCGVTLCYYCYCYTKISCCCVLLCKLLTTAQRALSYSYRMWSCGLTCDLLLCCWAHSWFYKTLVECGWVSRLTCVCCAGKSVLCTAVHVCMYVCMCCCVLHKKLWHNLAQLFKDEYKISAQDLFKLWTQRRGEQHNNINSEYVQNSDRDVCNYESKYPLYVVTVRPISNKG
jgi:hypothetical protein